MTAELSGKATAEGLWTAARKIRDHWVLVVFLTAAAVGARDLYEQYAALPQQVTSLRHEMVSLRQTMDQRGPVSAAGPSGAEIFPGSAHAVQDGMAGGFVGVRFDPVVPVWPQCRPGALSAYMRDARGRWFNARADIDRMPVLTVPEAVSVRLRIHPAMQPGRADLLVQFALDCDGRRQLVLAPRLPFRVLPNPTL